MNGQMTTLYDNAATENARQHFEFGKDLTADQIKNLQRDVIWYVQRQVNGYVVLVPMVYLCEETRKTLNTDSESGIYAKEEVKLIGGDLENSGKIKGKNVVVEMNNDILNINGKIIGDDSVSLTAGGNIKNESLVNTYDFGMGNISSKFSGQGLISSGGNLDMTAGKTIEIKAANVTAGGNASLTAKNINITTTELLKKTQVGGGDNMTKTKTVTNVGSTISIGGNLKLKTGEDTTIKGSNVSVGGNADITTGGGLNILSALDTYDSETRKKNESGGFCGVNSTTTVEVTKESKTTQVGSKLNIGGSLTATAGKDITVYSSDINVAKDAAITATGDINILSGQNTDSTYSSKTSDNLLDHGEEIHIHNSVNQVASNLKVGGDLKSMSGSDTTIVASNVAAVGDGVMIVGTSYDSAGNLVTNKDASLNVLSATNSEYDYSYKETMSKDIGAAMVATASGFATGGVMGGVAGFQAGQNAQNGNIKIKETYDTTEAGSSLNFGGNLTTVSAGDTNIVSSKITSSGDMQLLAGKGFDADGNLTTVNADAGVNVLAKEEIHNSKSSEEIIRADYLGAAVAGAIGGVASNVGGIVGGAAAGFVMPGAEVAGSYAGAYEAGNYAAEATKNIVNNTEKNTSEKSETKLASSEITSGGNLTMSGEKQILVVASNLNSSGDTNLISQGDVTIMSGEEKSHEKTTHRELSFDNVDSSSTRSSVSMNLSQKGNEKEVETDTTHQKSSNIQSGGDVNISSGKDTNIISSNLLTGGKTNIDATGDVNILALKDTSKTTTKEGTIKNTFTATVGNSWVETAYGASDAANTLYQMSQAENATTTAGTVNTAIAGAKAIMAAYAVAKTVANVANDAASAATFGFYSDVSMTQEREVSTSSVETSQDIGSVIYGNGLNIKSGNNITAKGAYLKAETDDINLNAKNDIKIESGESSQKTSSGYEKERVTTTLASSNGGSIPTLSFAKSESSSNSINQNNAQLLTENGTIKMTSGADTSLEGVNVKGKDIDMTGIGGKLSVVSKQDRSESESNSYSITLGQTMGFSISNSKASENWTNSQTSIIGTDSVKIKADEVNLTGSVIANKKTDNTDGGNLNIETNKLTYSDLKDKAESDSYSFSVGTTFGAAPSDSSKGANSGSADWENGTTNIAFYNGGFIKEGETNATIGNGNIVVNNETNPATEINRDITKSQIVTRDEKTGGYNADISISNSYISDVATKGLGAATSDLAKDAIKTFGDLPENAKKAGERVGDSATDVYNVSKAFVGGDLNILNVGTAYNKITDTRSGITTIQTNDKELTSDINSGLDGETTGDVQNTMNEYLDTRGADADVKLADTSDLADGANGLPKDGKSFTDMDTNNIYVNAGKKGTNLNNGADIVSSLEHEKIHTELKNLDYENRETISTLVGNAAGSAWNRENEFNGNTTGTSTTNQAAWLANQNANITQGNLLANNLTSAGLVENPEPKKLKDVNWKKIGDVTSKASDATIIATVAAAPLTGFTSFGVGGAVALGLDTVSTASYALDYYYNKNPDSGYEFAKQGLIGLGDALTGGLYGVGLKSGRAGLAFYSTNTGRYIETGTGFIKTAVKTLQGTTISASTDFVTSKGGDK